MSFSLVSLLILWKYCTLYSPALFKQTPNQSVLCEKELCESKILSEQDLVSLCLSSYILQGIQAYCDFLLAFWPH